MTSFKQRNILWIAIVLFIFVIAALVAYYLYLQNNRYTIVATGRYQAVEIDRVTGQSWTITGGKKTPHEHYKPTRSGKSLPLEELKKLTGGASIGQFTGNFYGSIYNGTDYLITSITFNLLPEGRPAMKLQKSLRIEPYSTEEFECKLPDGIKQKSWSIHQAIGYRP